MSALTPPTHNGSFRLVRQQPITCLPAAGGAVAVVEDSDDNDGADDHALHVRLVAFKLKAVADRVDKDGPDDSAGDSALPPEKRCSTDYGCGDGIELQPDSGIHRGNAGARDVNDRGPACQETGDREDPRDRTSQVDSG